MIVFRIGAIAIVLILVLISTQSTLPVVVADPWTAAPRQLVIGNPPSLEDVRKAIERDPFASHPSEDSGVGASAAPAHLTTTTTVGRTPGSGSVAIPAAPSLLPLDGNSPYVPNAGGGANAALPSGIGGSPMTGEITVVATVVGGGNDPRALIANGSETQVVGIGDLLGGRRITRIVTQGIEFSDGSRIAVESHDATGPASANAPARLGQPANAPGPIISGAPVAAPTPDARYPNGALGSGSGAVTPENPADVSGPQALPSPVPLTTPQDSPYTGTATLSPDQTAYPIIHYFSPPPGSPGTH